ncbi:MAG: hypothetical protein ACOCUH_04460, partial [Bacteriovoracia bacterium]
MIQKKATEPVTIVIFGASGDLTTRKLIPSLYNLFKQNYLPDDFKVICFARTQYSQENYANKLREFFDYGEDFKSFFKHVIYLSGKYDSDESYQKLKNYFRDTPPNRLFYMAVPPGQVKVILNCLHHNIPCTARAIDENNCCERYWSRLILEKPFGHDLESAKQLDQFLFERFREDQIF